MEEGVLFRSKQSNGFNHKRFEQEFLEQEEHATSIEKVTKSEEKI